jgi:hypothetical protein
MHRSPNATKLHAARDKKAQFQFKNKKAHRQDIRRKGKGPGRSNPSRQEK